MSRRNVMSRIGAVFVAALFVYSHSVHGQEVVVHRDLAYKTGSELSDYERERCVLDLYVPADASAFPVLLWFHGGNITAGDKADALHVDIARELAGRGIAVAAVNYRLSPNVNFPAYVEDAAAAVAWVLDNIGEYRGDSAAVFVSGHSAGAYLASLVGLDGRYLAAHGREVGELSGLVPISGQMITHGTVRTERGLPEERPIIDAAAPAYHVSASAPPFLAIAGSEDLPARAEENAYFIAAMQAVGHADAAYLEFAGRNHGSIVARIPTADDPVAAAIEEFVERLAGTFGSASGGRGAMSSQ